jgi:lipopolysaccharide/colanic/teichoic acid biosynthesis glycosyltransferase
VYASSIKRVFDLVVAALVLWAAAPLLLLAAIAIKLEDGGGVFYRQQRLGHHGQLFTILKLRSMTERVDRRPGEAGELTGAHPEISRIGGIIRRTKLDELPQLWNVLRGEMSLIGPRPCLPGQRDDFDDNGERRLAVRPGCSGLAQVHGNIHLSWPERWRYDAWYVENMSFLLDLEILVRTFTTILGGEARNTTSFDDFAASR